MLTTVNPAIGVLLCLSSGLPALSGPASPICSPYCAVYLQLLGSILTLHAPDADHELSMMMRTLKQDASAAFFSSVTALVKSHAACTDLALAS